MQTKTKLIGGAAAACAACCAVSLLPALLAGGGLAALSGAAFAGKEAFMLVAVMLGAAGTAFWLRRRQARNAAATCGCGGTCSTETDDNPSCTLPAK